MINHMKVEIGSETTVTLSNHWFSHQSSYRQCSIVNISNSKCRVNQNMKDTGRLSYQPIVRKFQTQTSSTNHSGPSAAAARAPVFDRSQFGTDALVCVLLTFFCLFLCSRELLRFGRWHVLATFLSVHLSLLKPFLYWFFLDLPIFWVRSDMCH